MRMRPRRLVDGNENGWRIGGNAANGRRREAMERAASFRRNDSNGADQMTHHRSKSVGIYRRSNFFIRWHRVHCNAPYFRRRIL
jgi:hypothetical protein